MLRDIITPVNDFLSRPEEALTIKTEIQNDSAGHPAEIHTLMSWKPKLHDFTIFVSSRNGSQATLTIDVKNIAYLNGKEPFFELRGELKDFTLDLVKPIITLIRIKFSKFAFTSKKGQKTVFEPTIAAIEFAGPLNFIKDLLDKIKLPGMGDDGGFGQPIVEVDTSRARPRLQLQHSRGRLWCLLPAEHQFIGHRHPTLHGGPTPVPVRFQRSVQPLSPDRGNVRGGRFLRHRAPTGRDQTHRGSTRVRRLVLVEPRRRQRRRHPYGRHLL